VSSLTKHGPPPADAAPKLGGTRIRLVRWAVNLWLVYHLAAIVVAPASVSPSSGLIQSAWSLFQPYLELLFLNHGYHFFAPEPSESTLLAYAAERPDGTVTRDRIPNFQIVPRLLYHRHFMLTEHMRDAPKELQDEWVGSYAEHIRHKYGASKVTLTGQIHSLPTMEMVRSGVRLDDPGSYQTEDLGVYQWGAQ
jgi:hypothetical protein